MATLDQPTPAISSDTKQLPLDNPLTQPEGHVLAQSVQPDAIKAAHAYFTGQAGGSAEAILPNLALTTPGAPGADQGDVYGPNATMPVGKHTFQPEAPGADGSPKRPDITEPTGKHTFQPEAPGADGSPKRPDVTEPTGKFPAPPEGPRAGGSQERPIAINADPEKLKVTTVHGGASTGGGSMDSDKVEGTIGTKTIPAYHQGGGSLGGY